MSKESLIKYWQKSKLISDSRLMTAFRKIPRENFIPDELKKEAYDDNPLPIGYNQTISQPTTILIMLQALELKKTDKVLEIGAGSGYNAALISYIVKKGKVYTLEIIPELVEFAKDNIERLKIKNIEIVKGDGSKGYKEEAPYDAIIVTASCPKIPSPLIKQLKNGGRLVIPVGPLYNQEMLKIIKVGEKLEIKNLGNFIFVPLKGEYGYNNNNILEKQVIENLDKFKF